MDAAYEVFGEEGFYEAKISRVAELAGIAKGTVYLYFSSKEDLFMAVTRRDCEHFLHGLSERLKSAHDLSGRLSAIAAHHLMYYYERKRHTKLFFRAPNNNPELMEYMASFLKDYMELVKKVLEEGAEENPLLLAQAFIGALDRLKMDILLDPSFTEEDVRTRTEFVSGLFLRGAGGLSGTESEKSS